MNVLKFANKVSTSRTELVRLARGSENGQATWYYIKVDKMKFPIYQQRLQKGETINVFDYSEVLHCGWGDNPPAEVTAEVQKLFETQACA